MWAVAVAARPSRARSLSSPLARSTAVSARASRPRRVPCMQRGLECRYPDSGRHELADQSGKGVAVVRVDDVALEPEVRDLPAGLGLPTILEQTQEQMRERFRLCGLPARAWRARCRSSRRLVGPGVEAVPRSDVGGAQGGADDHQDPGGVDGDDHTGEDEQQPGPAPSLVARPTTRTPLATPCRKVPPVPAKTIGLRAPLESPSEYVGPDAYRRRVGTGG